MKKGVKIALFIALGAVVLGAGICALSFAIGGFNLQNYMIGERIDLQSNTIEIKEDFTSVNVEMETGDIVFVPSADGACSVDAYVSKKADFSAEVRGGTLYVVCKDSRKWYERMSFFTAAREKLTLTLPLKDYQDLSIASTSSNIRVTDDFRFENADLTVTTGDVRFAAGVKEKLSINAVTGDLSVSDTQPKDLSLRVTTGDVSIANVQCGSLMVSGVTGDVMLSDTVAENDAQVGLTTGNVTLSSFDAKNISVSITTGDVTGSLLSEKTFKTKVMTGDVKVPSTSADGVCEISLVTGDIHFEIEK